MEKTIELLKGKKTFFVGALAIGYGIYFGEVEPVLLGLGLFGLRDGMVTEIAKVVTKSRKKK